MTTYTGAEFEPVFFERMAEWFRGGKLGPDPRGEWSSREATGVTWAESAFVSMPAFRNDFKYRWKPAKPRTVTIAGVELVAPKREALTRHSAYYTIDAEGNVLLCYWGNFGFDKDRLKNGNVFLTREAAQAMADIQRKQRIGE